MGVNAKNPLRGSLDQSHPLGAIILVVIDNKGHLFGPVDVLHPRQHQFGTVAPDLLCKDRLLVVKLCKVVIVEEGRNGSHPRKQVPLVHAAICLICERRVLLCRVEQQSPVDVVDDHGEAGAVRRSPTFSPRTWHASCSCLISLPMWRLYAYRDGAFVSSSKLMRTLLNQQLMWLSGRPTL